MTNLPQNTEPENVEPENTEPETQPAQQQAQQEPAQQMQQEQMQTNPYQAIIDQQQEQINALLQQTQALTGQITQMVQNGAQFTQQPQQQQAQVNPRSASNSDEWSIEALGREIGKPAKH